MQSEFLILGVFFVGWLVWVFVVLCVCVCVVAVQRVTLMKQAGRRLYACAEIPC